MKNNRVVIEKHFEAAKGCLSERNKRLICERVVDLNNWGVQSYGIHLYIFYILQ